LLKRPNPVKAGVDLFAEVIASKLLYGNSYLLAAGSAQPQELHLLNSNKVKIICTEGHVSAYHYQTNNKTLIYPVAANSCHSKILHLKNYNPTNNLYGLPTIKAAANSIRLHNLTTNWNSNLLKNGARPTGALIMKDSNGYLSDEQFSRLQEQLQDKYSGAGNAGKPLLLEGGLDWREMSINPKDMDFIESKNIAAREIALAFGVPPQLLGINGDNTYSNMQEARIALWEETLLPLLDRLSDSLTNWFAAWFGDDIVIDFDRDAISSLTEKRQNIWAKIANANFMTVNEKRALVGLPPITGGDLLV